MEHPHDPYHVRPFPKQPKRGGALLKAVLDELEKALSEKATPPEELRIIQKRLHDTANNIDDDALVNKLRHISEEIDHFEKKPQRAIVDKILQELMQVRVDLKHL